MTTGWRFRNRHLSGKLGFSENPLSDIRTLLKGVSEFVCTGNLHVNRRTRVQFHVRHLHLLLRSNCEFADGLCNEENSLIGTVNQNFLAFFMLSLYFDKITISEINQDVLSGCEFLVNRRILLTFNPYFLYLLSILCQILYYSSPHNTAQ